MTGACVAIPAEGLRASEVIRFLDCQALTIGEQGYRVLAAPGSVIGVALPGLLTIFVALIGYRMLVGETPSLREAVLTLAKLGLALSLATSWSAYRPLVYDVTLFAPAQLAASIGSAAQVPSANGLLARLDGVDRSVNTLETLAAAPGSGVRLTDGDLRSLRSARTLFLTSAIAVFGFVRMAAGLLLALGPLFASLLLFEATRGLVAGWLRGLTGTLLAAYASAVVFGIQLSLLEPWLTSLAEGSPEAGVGRQAALLLAVVTAFAVALAGVVALMLGVAASFRLPARYAMSRGFDPSHALASRQATEPAVGLASAPQDDRSRARRVADVVAATERRGEASAPASASQRLFAAHAGAGVGEVSDQHATRAAAAPSRRTAARVSATARDRDARQ